jgi:TP901 family phage tail tape measure protein
MQEVAESAKKAANGVSQSTDSFQEGMEKFKDNSAILERVKAFVGLEGGIEIARSAMRNAINTIKELDAVMAEMAVVTDLEVGDYWEQLPQHTKAANALGVAITEVYEAETLYLQQGLKMNDAQTMANTTLKMARIAGLSAADATDKMTAALRGFNMELNETSAQNVADVYSKLAAITAADVDEISTAMSKTASIASSAGMEFETTAAFLSQIIETTRESAETAGTAMKTVIARFSEVKNLQNEGIDTGTDEEGEVIDVNKI